MNILLVEDNPKIADLIRRGFKERLHHVDIAADGIQGEEMTRQNEYDAVILDLVLPGSSGLELCKLIRKYDINLPIILLTALGTTRDKITGFEAGADDYLTKPFHFEELLVRVMALWRRRMGIGPEMIYRVADLELDLHMKIARRSGKEILLTAKEFSLLELLMINKNRVLSRSYIAESIWGSNYGKGTNIIDVYINYLRAKIDKNFSHPLIHTIIGMGYTLKDA